MENWQRDYLKEEYFKLQDQYEDYDKRALQIKGWIGAGSIAGIAIGLDPGKSANGLIWILISILSGCFWYLEAKWKVFQYAISDRIRMIEAYFRDEESILVKDLKPLQIYHWWFKSYSKDKPLYPYEESTRPRLKVSRLWSAGTQGFVMLPYSLIILMCSVLFYCTLD